LPVTESPRQEAIVPSALKVWVIRVRKNSDGDENNGGNSCFRMCYDISYGPALFLARLKAEFAMDL